MPPTANRRELWILLSVGILILLAVQFDFSFNIVNQRLELAEHYFWSRVGRPSDAAAAAAKAAGRWGEDTVAGVADTQLLWDEHGVPTSSIISHVPGTSNSRQTRLKINSFWG